MRYLYFDGNEREFESFVLSALVSEANREKKTIELEHRFFTGFVADVFLPEGLSIFERQEEGCKPPFVVEIKKEFDENNLDSIIDKLTNTGFKGTFFYVSKWFKSRSQTLSSRVQDAFRGFKTVLLDDSFLDELSKNNPNAYLNHLLGSINTYLSNNTIKVSSNKKTDTLPESIKKIKIKKTDPDEISSLNSNEFKAYLGKGSDGSKCAVFIGNGVSIPFGSDNWEAMIKNLVDRLKPYYIENHEHVYKALSESSYALSSFVKSVLTREEGFSEYEKAIRYCIYRKYNEIMHDQPSLIKEMVKAKTTYKNLPLLTYNYDTFVEKQYRHDTGNYLGYYCGDNGDSNDVDALGKGHVIHLHGYLSYAKNNYKGIVLTDEDYFKAYLDFDSWSYKTQVRALTEHACLFVGSSMSDLFQMSLIQRAKKENGNEKWNCFALMCFKDLELKEKMQIIKYYKEKGIKVIFTEDFKELPGKLRELFAI